METQKTPNSQTNRAGGIIFPGFRLYYKATVIKTVQYWHKNRHIVQWSRIESPEINPHTWLINLWQRRQEWRKESLFNKWCWENWTATCKRMKIEHSLTSYTRINSKWIKDLNGRPDTIKLLEKNICRTLLDINCSNRFLDPSPRVMETKARINKWDQIKLTSFCTAKETIDKMKRQLTEWEMILSNDYDW